MMPGRTRTVVGGSHRDGREVPMIINAGFTIYSSIVSNREFFFINPSSVGTMPSDFISVAFSFFFL